MALNKSKKTIPCLVHVLLYTSVFLFITTSWKALVIIGVIHFILDRFPIIIRRMIWFKNHLNPNFTYPPFVYCDSTGYYDDSIYNTKSSHGKDIELCPRPSSWGKPRHFFITIWLYIITDNFLHLLTNYLAIKYFS